MLSGYYGQSMSIVIRGHDIKVCLICSAIISNPIDTAVTSLITACAVIIFKVRHGRTVFCTFCA